MQTEVLKLEIEDFGDFSAVLFTLPQSANEHEFIKAFKKKVETWDDAGFFALEINIEEFVKSWGGTVVFPRLLGTVNSESYDVGDDAERRVEYRWRLE